MFFFSVVTFVVTLFTCCFLLCRVFCRFFIVLFTNFQSKPARKNKKRTLCSIVFFAISSICIESFFSSYGLCLSIVELDDQILFLSIRPKHRCEHDQQYPRVFVNEHQDLQNHHTTRGLHRIPAGLRLPGLEKALGLQQALFLRVDAPSRTTGSDDEEKQPSLWRQAQSPPIT